MRELDHMTQSVIARDESRFEVGIRDIAISHKSFKDVMIRVIDDRPGAPLMAADEDWGEQDSLANIPRRTMEPWVRALTLKDGE